jgi:hypothetical protein
MSTTTGRLKRCGVLFTSEDLDAMLSFEINPHTLQPYRIAINISLAACNYLIL